MAKTSTEVPGVGTVYITKKRGQKNIRLRVDNKGLIQVSMPWLVPKSAVYSFVRSKNDWIKQQQASYDFKPYDGMLLGKTLVLNIQENSPMQRVKQHDKKITIPFTDRFDQTDVTHLDKVKKAVMKALRVEAEKFLLPRLREIAEMYGFTYNSAGIKQVIGRWGSCDSRKHISLSLYLIQLPIEYIDYVLIHELAHTKHMNHSSAFWAEVERLCPDYKLIRRKMRGLQPRIYDAKEFMA